MEQTQNRSLSIQKIISGIDGIILQQENAKDTNDLNSIGNKTLINGITQDSRKVKPGYLFAALRGDNSDGADFIVPAIEKGAVAVLCETRQQSTGNIVLENIKPPIYITHPNPKLALAYIAANFYQKQPEVIAAITGTNGKTSTAFFCTEIWQLLGKKTASIGTIGICTNNGLDYGATGSMTTPDPIELHKILANLSSEGITHLAMEASSHGLDQYRLDAVNIKAAAFTNITRDHLDYHGTFEKYLTAKLRLFDVMKDGVAVINADIPEATQIINLCEEKGHKVLSVGKAGKYITIDDVTKTSEGQQIAFEVAGRLYTVNTPLIGEFQAYNLLTALALTVACGANLDEAVSVLPNVSAVPGRMQGVRLNLGPGTQNLEFPSSNLPNVYVDYSHTPDALEKALKVLRPYAGEKLWVVFGCGGDRDKGKRPQMGEVANKLADMVVVTDDNPRSEVASTIRSEIIQACPEAKEIGNRFEAISYAISNMGNRDILLIAGKGHEKTQIIGDNKLDFDDVKVAGEIILRKVNDKKNPMDKP